MNNRISLLSATIHHKKVFLLSLFAYVAMPVFVLAAGLVPCDGTAASPCTFNSLAGLVNGVINWFLGISVSVAAITFVVAGARMLLHPTNEAERGAAKEMFFKTVIGLLIILCAWLVIHTVIAALVPNAAGPNGALRFLGN